MCSLSPTIFCLVLIFSLHFLSPAFSHISVQNSCKHSPNCSVRLLLFRQIFNFHCIFLCCVDIYLFALFDFHVILFCVYFMSLLVVFLLYIFLLLLFMRERFVPVLKILAIGKTKQLTDRKYGDSQQIDAMKNKRPYRRILQWLHPAIDHLQHWKL